MKFYQHQLILTSIFFYQAKDNVKNVPSAAAQTLQLQCSLNLMSCYLKTGQFNECITEGTEVLLLGLSIFFWT